jgi:hypothetical protein
VRSFQVDRRWSLVAILIVAVLLIALVGVRLIGSAASTSPGGGSSNLSPYGQLFAQIQPDGTVSKETALEAFALAIAPLPGVTPPSGPDPLPYERDDGTFAIEWLRPYMEDLTPDQKAVVGAALGITIPASGAGPTSSQPRAAAQLASDNQYVDAVNAAQPTIAAKLGRSLNLSWSVVVDATQPQGSPSEFAITYTSWFPLYGSSSCTIHVHPLLVNASDPAVVKATMAHELFHCFQYDWFDQHGGYRKLPDWIIEGQAEWAGENAGGPSNAGRDWWGTYLISPEDRLWQRSYDAVGFYQHMAEEGVDPWQHFDAMLAATDNVGAFQAAGANADVFEDTWSSGFFRDAGLGPWNAAGPWTLTAKAVPHQLSITIGDSKDLAANAVTDQDWVVTSYADVLEVHAHGHVRMRTDPDGNETDTGQRWLCTKAGGCACPAGERFVGPELETVAPTIKFGLTGGLDGAGETLVGHGLDEYCKPLPTGAQQTSPPGSPCPTCGQSNGDPHLRTINRYRYDFQAAGEFTLLRSRDGSVDIQARQVPVRDSSFQGVSANSAVAARLNGHRVGIYAAPDTGILTLKVDAQPRDAASGIDLGAGSGVLAVPKGFVVTFSDSTTMRVLSVGPWGINAIIQPSAALAAEGTGLLGPIVPGGLGVPALPDGTLLPAAPDKDTRSKTVYGQFADAWRVTDATTLFDYDPGQSTATFTDRSWPHVDPEQALASISPDQQSAASTACASITDPELRAECVYDVEATGDDGYAQSYQAVQDFYDSGISTPSPSPLSGMTAAVKVADAIDIAGAVAADDGTLVVSFHTADGKAALAAIDARTGAVRQRLDEPVATDLHLASGSVWAAGLSADAGGQNCTVTRLDPDTLSVQATFPIPCAFGYPGPHLASTGTSVWFVDTSSYDVNQGTGARLTRIDPETNRPGKSVPLASTTCCIDGPRALWQYGAQSVISRLTDTDNAFEDLGNYSSIIPAGSGFWTDSKGPPQFVDGPGGPGTTIQLGGTDIADGRLVGGDTAGVYLQVDRGETDLYRVAADASPPVQIAVAPILGSGINETFLDYLVGGPRKFALKEGLATIWLVQGSMYLQWAPLP